MKTTTNATVTFKMNRCGIKKRFFVRKAIQSCAATVGWEWQANGFEFDLLHPFDPIHLEWIFKFTGEDVIECGEIHTRSWMDMESIIDAELNNIMGAIEGVEITAKYEFEHTEESAAEIAQEIEAEARECQ